MRTERGILHIVNTARILWPEVRFKGPSSLVHSDGAGDYSSALYSKCFANSLIDICKVNIEGAEHEVFRSAPDGPSAQVQVYRQLNCMTCRGPRAFPKSVTTPGSGTLPTMPIARAVQTQRWVFQGPLHEPGYPGATFINGIALRN